MKFKKLNSSVEVNVNIANYKIDWEQKVSAPQKKVTDFLRQFWEYDYVLQEFRVPGSLLRFDIVNITKKIIVEVSPASTHDKYSKFIHKSRGGFLKRVKSDADKKKWAEQNEFSFIELGTEDIKNLSKEMIEEKFEVII